MSCLFKDARIAEPTASRLTSSAPGACLSTQNGLNSKGRGEIYTYTIVYRPANPCFQEDAPYNVAVVQLEEGVRMATNIVDCANEDLKIGMAVEVTFDDVTGEITLPKFKPVGL